MITKEMSCYVATHEEFKESLLFEMEERLKGRVYNLEETSPDEKLMTVEETMAFLKCSKQALWNWNKNGVLPSHKVGRRVYYKKSEILNQLVKQE